MALDKDNLMMSSDLTEPAISDADLIVDVVEVTNILYQVIDPNAEDKRVSVLRTGFIRQQIISSTTMV